MVESAARRALRLLDLVPFLKANPGISVSKAAKSFEVSEAELIKDLNLLFLCGLPGYTPLELIDISFDDGIIVVTEPQNLDSPRQLSRQESLILRIALSELADALPENKQAEVVALNKKIAALFHDFVPAEAIAFQGDKAARVLTLVRSALDTQRKLEIVYHNSAKDEVTRRLISPVQIDVHKEKTLIRAWCDLVGGMRTFNLSNIDEAGLTESPIEVGKSDSSDSITTAVLQIVKTEEEASVGWIEGSFYDVREISSQRVELDFYQSEWLLRNLLSLGARVELIEPTELRDELVRIASSALLNYD